VLSFGAVPFLFAATSSESPTPGTGGAGPRALQGGSPTLVVTPGSDYVGSFVNVTGGGYPTDAELNLTLGPQSTEVVCVGSTSNVTNSTGNLSCMFQVPTVVADPYDLNATNASSTGTTTLTVLAPTLSLVPATGPVQSSVVASGVGYPPLAAVTLEFGPYGISRCSSGSLAANGTGGLSCTFPVPTLPNGTYAVTAVGSVGQGSTTFVVNLPTLRLAPSAGHPGVHLTVSGTAFIEFYTVSLEIGSVAIAPSGCLTGSLTTNASGGFSCVFDVPALTAGVHEVEASDANNTGFANFTVNPFLSLSPGSGSVGQTVTATGSGFPAGAAYTVEWNSTTTVCSGGSTDANGGFSCAFTVPHSPQGPDSVLASAGDRNAVADFTVEPSFELSPLNATGPVGSSVQVLGVGYDASEPFNVTYDGIDLVCSSSTDTIGDLDCSFDVPASVQGGHTVTVHEGAFNDSETFTVQPQLGVNPASGIAGTEVDLSGTGFGGSTTYAYCLETGDASCPGDSPTFVTDAVGNVPTGQEYDSTGLSPGVYYVIVSTGSTVDAFAYFTVTSAMLSIGPGSGPVGTAVTLAGTMFLANEQYSYCFSATAGVCSGASLFFTANASGDIPSGTALVVPYAPHGAYFVNVVQSGLLVADAGFEVNASLALAPPSGPVGLSVSAAGNGLDSDAAYLLEWAGSETVCTGATNATGSFACQFSIPATAEGPALAVASVGSLQPTATFTVLPSLALDPPSGTVGGILDASGEGYAAAVDYSVNWNGSEFLCGGTTTSLGAFSCSGTVPSEPAGVYPVNGSDGPDFAEATFTVVASVSLSDATGFVGDSVTAGGAGFDSDRPYTVTWDGTTQLCSGSTANDGAFSCTFTVPISVGGLHTVAAAEGIYAPMTQFTLGASLMLSPSSGKVGSTVTATADGFADAGSFSVTWGTDATLCAGTVEPNGAFSCQFTVPNSPSGSFSVLAAQGSSEAGAQFIVGPSVALAAASGTVGSTATVSGTGLAAAGPVTIAWNNLTTVCEGSANTSGGFSCNFTIPFASFGAHSVDLVQGSIDVAFQFTVQSAFVANATSGPPGAPVELAGTGFDANSPFSISWNSSTSACAGTTNATGSFVCAFDIPTAAPAGAQEITVTEGENRLSVTFTVASTPPPTMGPSPFPWWIVVAVALIVGVLLILFILGERQHRAARHRRASGRTSGSRSSAGTDYGRGSAGPTAPVEAPATGPVSTGDLATFDSIAGAGASAPASTESPEDIDALISRLERMSEQLYKKKPAELGDVRNAGIHTEDEPPTD
jgi:hypothetical protein